MKEKRTRYETRHRYQWPLDFSMQIDEIYSKCSSCHEDLNLNSGDVIESVWLVIKTAAVAQRHTTWDQMSREMLT